MIHPLRFVAVLFFTVLCNVHTFSQRGYFDAPYKRYEANVGTLSSATVLPKSYNQSDLQSEASEQICVNLFNTNASVEWTLTEAADGLVVRYSVPDGQSGTLGVYSDGTKVNTLTLTSTWSWEYLSTNGNANNTGVVNANPKMRFDEVRLKLNSKIPLGGKLKLVRETGNISIDFVEMEPVPVALTAPVGAVTYSGNGSTLQTFIDANGGKTIFLPAGVYSVNRKLWFGADNTKLIGAGMWYTQINFTYYSTTGSTNEGGLYADAVNISFSDLYLTTVRNSRTNSYKAINGIFTSTSVIENIWAEHFEAGAWIGQYFFSATAYANGFTMRNCRFRNNYADGVNLCKGTQNAIVTHCNFRNNGDDDMAVWSADGLECIGNTFSYNTSENCWRASGCAIYGGMSNKAQHLLIRDNLEVGLRVNNCFAGIGFNTGGLHEFTDIGIENCGTMNDLFNNPVGAIDLVCSNKAGTRINNVKFSGIDILNSKNDAIFINKSAGEGFYNIIFENIKINGTGKEYPDNNMKGISSMRGYGLLFLGNPTGNATYCGLTYANRGGNAISDTNTSAIGTLTWSGYTGCVTTVPENQSKEADNIENINFKLKITGSIPGETLLIYNLMGLKVLSKQMNNAEENIETLEKGIYIVLLNQSKLSKRIIIN